MAIVDAVKHLLAIVKIDPNEFRIGKTKIFIKEPRTIFALEALREKELPRLATQMNSVVRGYIARKQHNRSIAVKRVIALFRWARSKKYMVDVIQTFKGSGEATGFNLRLEWPKPPPVLAEAKMYLEKVHQRGWAWSLISKFTTDMPAVRTKLLAYDMFNQKKPWCPGRKWDALYLEKEGSPYRGPYVKAAQACIAKGGDNEICYCDVVNKTNSAYKMQLRGIVVTNMNIYKHDPKNFKVANKPIPIAEIVDVTVSPTYDQWIIIHTSNKQQDLLLDLSLSSKIEEERLSEFVTILTEAYKALTRNDLPVKFSDNSSFRGKASKSIQVSFKSGGVTATKVQKEKTGLQLCSPGK
jgi:myosin-1